MNRVFLGRSDAEISQAVAAMDSEQIREIKRQCEDDMYNCDEYSECVFCPYESRVLQLCKVELSNRAS